MYQAFKELRAAPIRSGLMTLTIGMIAIMVTFLSALAAGLAYESASAVEVLTSKDDVVFLSEGTALAGSVITPEEHAAITAWASDTGTATQEWFVQRAKVGGEPVTVIAGAAGANPTGEEITLSGAAGEVTVPVYRLPVTGWKLDHQEVILTDPASVNALAGREVSPAAIVATTDVVAPAVPGINTLRGKDRFDLSAAYAGQQLTLSSMMVMLYVISALVVGSFFAVWTVQRLRGVAITKALGAQPQVLFADSALQALGVLVVGVGGGVLVTVLTGWYLQSQGTMPIVIEANTTFIPALILAATGLVGAVVSLVPVIRIDPTTALAQAG